MPPYTQRHCELCHTPGIPYIPGMHRSFLQIAALEKKFKTYKFKMSVINDYVFPVI